MRDLILFFCASRFQKIPMVDEPWLLSDDVGIHVHGIQGRIDGFDVTRLQRERVGENWTLIMNVSASSIFRYIYRCIQSIHNPAKTVPQDV